MFISTDILSDIKAYCDSSNPMGSLANISAVLFTSVPNLNWVGFYLNDGEQLRVGPFQGKPACTHIAFNRGVCGAAFTQRKTVVVNDVSGFSDHIACDAASQSEVVIPLGEESAPWGVLDIDSPLKNRFSDEDVKLFEHIGVLISRELKVTNSFFNKN